METRSRRLRWRARVLLAAAALPMAGAQPVGTPERADAALAACDEAVRREPERLSSYTCYGRLAVGSNLWEAAIDRLERHASARPESPYPLGALAYLTGLRGEARTETLLRRILSIYERREDPPLGEVVWTRVALAQFLAQRGRSAEALTELEVAERAASSAGDPEELANVTIRRSELLRRLGEFDLAASSLREIEPVVRGTRRVYLRRDWLSATGAALFELGLAEEAIDSWERERDVLAEIGDRRGVAAALHNIALASEELVRQGRLDTTTCVRRYEQTLSAARAAGDRHAEARALCFLARQTQDPEQRTDLLRDCVAVAETTGHAALLADVWVDQARELLTKRSAGELDRGLELLDRALALASDAADPLIEARVRFARHELFWWIFRERGRDPHWKDAALVEGRELLAVDEALRGRQTEAATRVRLMDRRAAEFEQLAGNLLLNPAGAPARADVELAFETLERKRAQELLRQLELSRSPRISAAGTSGSAEWRSAWRDLRWLRGRLRQGGLDRAGTERLRAQAARLEARIDELRASERSAGTPLDLLQAPGPVALARVEHSLGKNEAVLSYQIDSRGAGETKFTAGSWVLVHSAGGTGVVHLEDCPQIALEAEWLNGLIDRRDGSERAAAARLFELLLRPALELLPDGIERLVIVPDAELAALPFAALGPAEGPPLGVRFALSRAPSLSAWLSWRESDDAPAKQVLLALADPSPAQGGALPAARYEAREAVRTLGGGSRLKIGADAAEAGLAQLIEGFRMLHLATHAEVDGRHPDRSAVQLAAGGGADGRLLPAEILELDLSGRVVALASCRGASGLRVEGEGAISLARSFLASGAHAVLAALDPLREGEAAALFPELYRGLAEGESLDRALQQARQRRWRAGEPAAAWSRLLLIGDGSHVVLPGGRSVARANLRWLALAAGLLALLALARYVGLRFRRPDPGGAD